MNLRVSRRVLEKLGSKHGVTIAEVEECLANREGRFLVDSRERHRTRPPTRWFIANTDRGRSLKMVFVLSGRMAHLRTAFEPDDVATRIYYRYGYRR
jgi:uncharacterized DUF497 family protein